MLDQDHFLSAFKEGKYKIRILVLYDIMFFLLLSEEKPQNKIFS